VHFELILQLPSLPQDKLQAEIDKLRLQLDEHERLASVRLRPFPFLPFCSLTSLTEIPSFSRPRPKLEPPPRSCVPPLITLLHPNHQARRLSLRLFLSSKQSSLSTTLNQSLTSEVIRLKTEFDTQIIVLQNEHQARVNFDFVSSPALRRVDFSAPLRPPPLSFRPLNAVGSNSLTNFPYRLPSSGSLKRSTTTPFDGELGNRSRR